MRERTVPAPQRLGVELRRRRVPDHTAAGSDPMCIKGDAARRRRSRHVHFPPRGNPVRQHLSVVRRSPDSYARTPDMIIPALPTARGRCPARSRYDGHQADRELAHRPRMVRPANQRARPPAERHADVPTPARHDAGTTSDSDEALSGLTRAWDELAGQDAISSSCRIRSARSTLDDRRLRRVGRAGCRAEGLSDARTEHDQPHGVRTRPRLRVRSRPPASPLLFEPFRGGTCRRRHVAGDDRPGHTAHRRAGQRHPYRQQRSASLSRDPRWGVRPRLHEYRPAAPAHAALIETYVASWCGSQRPRHCPDSGTAPNPARVPASSRYTRSSGRYSDSACRHVP